MAISEEILRDVERLDREDQLNLAQWILGLEEKDFDLSETPDDLRAIRRGLEELNRDRTLSTEQVKQSLTGRPK